MMFYDWRECAMSLSGTVVEKRGLKSIILNLIYLSINNFLRVCLMFAVAVT